MIPGLPSSSGEWISAHIYMAGHGPRDVCDRMILELVAPLLGHCRRSGWIKGSFYIRYWEYGPHLRLRLMGDALALDEAVRPLVEDAVRQFPSDLRADPEPDALTIGTASTAKGLLWMPYYPEIERYGGRAATTVAEQVFSSSTELAIELLRLQRDRNDPGLRLGLAVAAATILLKAFCSRPAEAMRIAASHRDHYAGVWRPTPVRRPWTEVFDAELTRTMGLASTHVLRVWQAAESGSDLPTPLGAYYVAMQEARAKLISLVRATALTSAGEPVRTWTRAAAQLLPSYVHMTNNRLGVSPIEEAYLSHSIVRALSTQLNSRYLEPAGTST